MLALPISKSRFKSNIYSQNSPEITFFFAKKCNIFERWGSVPRPRASGGWSFVSRPPKQSPHCEFLAMRLHAEQLRKSSKYNRARRSHWAVSRKPSNAKPIQQPQIHKTNHTSSERKRFNWDATHTL